MWTSIALTIGLGLTHAPESVPALEGKDPVALCAGLDVAGVAEFEAEHGRYAYRFSNGGNRERFLADPERYGIQWGGACGRMGPLSGSGDPDRWALHDGRLYIFASEGCRSGFLKSPERFVVERAELGEVRDEARAAAEPWIAKALEAHGGAERIDATRSLLMIHEGVVDGWTQRLELEVSANGALRRRSVWTPPEEGAQSHDTTWQVAAMTSASPSFTLTSEERLILSSPDQLDDLRRFVVREPLGMLWARTRKDFVALAMGPGLLGEQPVENLLVRVDGLLTTWHMDPESGRLLGLSWRGRLNDGVTRDLVETFTRFELVDGLVTPAERQVSADGKVAPALAKAWTEMRVVAEPVSVDVQDR